MKYRNMAKNFSIAQKSDYKTMLEAVKCRPNDLAYGSCRIKKNKEIAKVAVKNSGNALEHVSEKLKDDFDVVMAAVTNNGMSLKYASTRLRADLEIVKAATLSTKGCAIYYASYVIRDNEDFAVWLMGISPSSYKYLSNRLMQDLDIFSLALSGYPKIFSFAPDSLKDNNYAAYDAVLARPKNLKYVSNRLRNEEYIVIPALAHDPKLLKYASDRIRDNRKIIEFMLSLRPSSLKYVPDKFRDDEDLVIRTVKTGSILCTDYVSDRVKRSRRFWVAAINAGKVVLDDIPDELKDDYELFELAVEKNPLCIKYASERIRDSMLALTALQENPRCLEYVSDRLQRDSKLVLDILRLNPDFDYIPEQLAGDYNFAREAIKIRGSIIFLLSDDLKKNREAIMRLLKEA